MTQRNSMRRHHVGTVIVVVLRNVMCGSEVLRSVGHRGVVLRSVIDRGVTNKFVVLWGRAGVHGSVGLGGHRNGFVEVW